MNKSKKEPVEQSNSPENMVDINTDENMGGTTHLNEPVVQEDEVEMLRNQVAELKDKYLRQAADFENGRKRLKKEMDEVKLYASRDVIESLLQVLDDSERAEKQLNSNGDTEAVREGIQLVFQKLRKSLQARGLKEMESIGKEFNPDIHEAITEIPAPSEDWKGKVIDEIEKGYYLNDKIIRFAKVVVGK